MSKNSEKLVFNLELAIKDCDKVFAAGFNPGVFVTQTVAFDKALKASPILAGSVQLACDTFMRENVEVRVTPADSQAEAATALGGRHKPSLDEALTHLAQVLNTELAEQEKAKAIQAAKDFLASVLAD